ncbi:MAG: molybdopterin-dependent oxidoreductase [Desulfobacterales bacterium]|nr:molybdopterin-dependent oxidoreductase [Desulfobacterales bacterium]
MNKPLQRITQTIPVSCNKDCGAGCPLLAHVRAGRIIKITNNPAGTPYMKGCSKGYQAMQAAYAPDRLLKPMIRTGPRGSGDFKTVSWDEALDHAASGLRLIKETYGRDSIIFLGGSGSCRGALHNTSSLTNRFLNMLGSNVKLYGNYSSSASDFVTPFVFGTLEVGIDAGTLQHSELIILWGANIMDTRFGCEYPTRIREAANKGVPVIVIDPRKSNTVKLPHAQWVQIRPGTDTAMMAAVLYELIGNDQVDYPYLEKYCIGFNRVKNYILGSDDNRPKTPEWAEQICGTPAGIIKKLAEMYGNAKPAALIPGLSIQRNIGGEEAMRMAMVLQAATGNIGKMGGASGGCLWDGLPVPECGEMDTADIPGDLFIPEYRWPDAILEGKEGGHPVDIKAIYNVGGNYLSQGSDINKNIRAFNKVEFSVCHEQFMTPTAKHCDVILPASFFLEREDILFPGMNYLFYSGKAIDPPDSVKDDYDIFCELSDRLGFPDKYSEGKTSSQWIEQFIAESEIADVEQFKQTGVYSGKDQMRIGLSDFFADPLKNPLKTPSGKIELASENYAKTGFPAIPTYRGMADEDKYPLRMITPSSLHRINSSYCNIQWFKDRETQALWMNISDAEKRGITNGEVVSVWNSCGKIRIPASVSEDIMPGVVCLIQGFWPDIDDDGTDRAGAANMLTSTEPTEPCMGSRTHSVTVEVGLAKSD